VKFKIDENLPDELADELAAMGHDAHTVEAEGLIGAEDQVILNAAHREQRILLTQDKGIANVQVYPPKQYSGIVLLRPKSTGRRATLDFARRHLPDVIRSVVAGKLLIVTELGIRIR
jgi:predicted nuclease of predicted toxin-antitoxin system